MSFLLESVEGGAVRGRYSIIGLEPGSSSSASTAGMPRSTARSRPIPAAFVPIEDAAARGVAQPHRRKPHRAAARSAADGGRRVRLSRLRHGAADGGFAAAGARPIGIPDAMLMRPTLDRRLRCGQGHHHRRHAGAGACRGDRQRRRWRARPSGCPRSSTRSTGRSTNRRPTIEAGPLDVKPRSNTTPDELQADGDARQGLHRRRRYLSGRAVAALRGAVRAAAVFALPGAAPRQSLALSVLSRFRHVRRRRIEPGNPGQDQQRRRHHPADRRHPAARRDAA